jgi:superfamily II DNA or RNA helicase
MSNPDVIIRKIDESYIAVDCAEESVASDLNSFFTMFAPKYQYHPLYKCRPRKWDGKIRLYSAATHRLYGGLLRYVLAFLQERNLKVEIQDGLDTLANFSVAEAEEWFKALNPQSGGKSITAHEHQIIGLAKALRYKKILLVSPTASGKSLMMYGITRYLIHKNGGGCKRGLIIVPTINLVAQLESDFLDYSDGKLGPRIQTIYQGQSKTVDKEIVISTWQSIYDMPRKWFEQFDYVIGDEAHGFKAESLKKIMCSLVNAKYRIGTTGTLDGTQTHRMVVEGHFGPHTKLTTTKDLQDKGLIAKIKPKALILKHRKEEAKALKKQAVQLGKDYRAIWKAEMDYLVAHQRRNQFIANLAKSLKDNVLILFNYIDHGQSLADVLITLGADEQVFIVNGSTDVEIREDVRRLAENTDDTIIIASYGVFSTGVNIKNIHHIIFASPSKSRIRVLQSIGRGLRLAEGKDSMTLYDITDDLRSGKEFINFTLRQFVKRLEYYNEEGWKVSKYNIEL